MNEQQIRELVEKLTRMSNNFTIGWKNEEAIREMGFLLRQLEWECSGNGYLGEKLGSARDNLEMMFSPRKHLRYGGAETIANRFRSDIHLIIKWIDGPGRLAREDRSPTELEP